MTDKRYDHTDDEQAPRTARSGRYSSYRSYVPLRPAPPPPPPDAPPAIPDQPAKEWDRRDPALSGASHEPAEAGWNSADQSPAVRLNLPAGTLTAAERGWPYEETGDRAYDAEPADTAPRRGGGNPIGRMLRMGWPLLLLLLAKWKWVLALLKFKAFSTFATMLVSIWAYALFFGLPFAVGLVVLLFIHEMGHALILKRQGVKATAPLFIPFMGAVIGMKEMPKNVYAEAQMALGGPIVGSLGALGCLVLWQVTGSSLFIALAYLGFWLNLFNLIPVSPLDGGRAMGAISPWGWIVGLVLLVALFLRLQSLFLGFILLVGGMEVFNRWRNRNVDRAYYEVTGRQRLAVAVVYFGLAAVLALSMNALEPLMFELRPQR